MSNRLPNDKVIELVRWFWENGVVRTTFHFRQELLKAGATMQDVEALIRGSFQVKSANWKSAHRRWNYELVGYDEDGVEISIVISLDQKNSILFFITAF